MSNRTISHWVAFVTVVALLGGLALAARQWRRQPATSSGPGTAQAPGNPADPVIERALGQIPATVDSAEIKARWLDEVAGLDVSELAPEKQEIFLRHANSQHCTCGCGYTLAGCRASDMTCDVSLGRVESLLDSVRTGRIRTAAGVRERPAHGG